MPDFMSYSSGKRTAIYLIPFVPFLFDKRSFGCSTLVVLVCPSTNYSMKPKGPTEFSSHCITLASVANERIDVNMEIICTKFVQLNATARLKAVSWTVRGIFDRGINNTSFRRTRQNA